MENLQVRLLAFQLMPDHVHGILFVQETMEEHLGQVISGFKAGCNKAFRRLVGGDAYAHGRLLLLAPWPHQNERVPLTRAMCLALNKMAEDIVHRK